MFYVATQKRDSMLPSEPSSSTRACCLPRSSPSSSSRGVPLAMSVEWRILDGADAIVLVEPNAEAVSEVPTPDAAVLKAYLAVSGNLEHWRRSMAWRPIDGDNRDSD